MPGMATVFSSRVLIFKAMLRNDTRRFALAENAANLERVTEMVRYYFDIEEGECFNVYYVNSIGDMLGLSSEEDFADACSHAKVKSDLERELALVVDRGLEPEMELPALARITRRMQLLEIDLLNSMNEVNAIIDGEANLSSPPRQLPRWLAAEGLYYETVRGDSPSALSDVEETELESVLLPSPRRTVTTFTNNSGLPQSSSPAIPEEVIYDEDFEPYTDDDEISDDRADDLQTPRGLFVQLISPAKEVKFRVPFPAFVPFPPSPTSSSHVFSLCESTPFPFPVSSVVSTCSCKCTCSRSRQATTTAEMSVGTDDVVKNGVGTQSEKSPFKFVVSVGTQCALLPSTSQVHFVSIGTQTDAAYHGVAVGTQTDAASQSEAVAAALKNAAVVCNVSAQTEKTPFTSLPTSLPSSPLNSIMDVAETNVKEATVASENEDADYEML